MLVSNNYSSIKTNKNNQNNYFYFLLTHYYFLYKDYSWFIYSPAIIIIFLFTWQHFHLPLYHRMEFSYYPYDSFWHHNSIQTFAWMDVAH